MQIESLPEWEPLQRILTSAGAKPDASEVRRAAAMLGPGWSGRRANLAKEDAQRAAQEILRAWSDAELGDAPAYLIQAASGDALEWRDRRAKLFEIGEYDDRGLRVTQEDVVRLAQSFDSPVPILVEQVETPLRLRPLPNSWNVIPKLPCSRTLLHILAQPIRKREQLPVVSVKTVTPRVRPLRHTLSGVPNALISNRHHFETLLPETGILQIQVRPEHHASTQHIHAIEFGHMVFEGPCIHVLLMLVSFAALRANGPTSVYAFLTESRQLIMIGSDLAIFKNS